MRGLSAGELLDVWERGLAQTPARRALLLLDRACDQAAEGVAQFSVGRRDAELLALREQIFGSRLASLASCPACAGWVEFEVEAQDLRATAPHEIEEPLEVVTGGYAVQFRVPSSLDLARLDPAADPAINRQRLLQECVVQARCGDADVLPSALPPAVVAAMTQRMAEADPQAEVQLALACPQCRHQWQSTFDIVSYFWSEIHSWAGRALREIHALASAYGWREADVLALSPRRRQAYLKLIEA